LSQQASALGHDGVALQPYMATFGRCVGCRPNGRQCRAGYRAYAFSDSRESSDEAPQFHDKKYENLRLYLHLVHGPKPCASFPEWEMKLERQQKASLEKWTQPLVDRQWLVEGRGWI
jgi:hypothetical protein